MKKLIVYIHGREGLPYEADHYISLFKDADVVGFDYKSSYPWEAKDEFPQYFDRISAGYNSVSIIANSLGAFFSLIALGEKQLASAVFISPVVDMEKLISDMMGWGNISEAELMEKKQIVTSFGEELSWDYLCYVRENPIKWKVPTYIIYGAKDHLTSFTTISDFAGKNNAKLFVMEDGEHWFHTEEQMNFIDDVITKINEV